MEDALYNMIGLDKENGEFTTATTASGGGIAATKKKREAKLTQHNQAEEITTPSEDEDVVSHNITKRKSSDFVRWSNTRSWIQSREI